jgi:hypothetical protein
LCGPKLIRWAKPPRERQQSSRSRQELFVGILGRLGAGSPHRIYSPLTDVFHRAKKDPKQREIFDALAPRSRADGGQSEG